MKPAVNSMHILRWFLLEYVFGMVGYAVARLALPIVSFGKVHVAPLAPCTGGFNLIGYRRNQSGRIEIEPTAAALVGLVMCIFMAFVLALLIRGSL